MPEGGDLRVVIMGTGTFAEPTFRALLESGRLVAGLVTQPDRPVGAQRGTTRQTGPGMKELAVRQSIAVFQPESVNTPDGIAGLQALRPDLLVVAAYGQILSRDVLSVPPRGGINVHASLLPKYRGAAPVAWAIYQGETRTGVTVIRMSPFLDAGEVLAQEAIDIGPEETAGELEERLAALGARLALQVVDQIAAGTARGIAQDKSQVTKAPKLTKEHGLIDWTRGAQQVCNQIRAMQPWPTAYTFLHVPWEPSERLIVHRARFAQIERAWMRNPGAIDVVQAKEIIVYAGDGQGVSIEELQPAGKRRMTAKDYLRGHDVTGTYLGAEGD